MKTMMFLAALATLAFAAQSFADTTTPTTATSTTTTGANSASAPATAPTNTSGTATAATDTSSTQKPGKMTDQQIAGVMKQANDAEIAAAKMAQAKAKDAQVKKFATHMVKEHTKNNKMAMGVEKRADISPVSSPSSNDVKKDAATKGKALKNAASNFDRTYIDQQVAMHSQLLKDLDGMYIPQAQNAEMKAFLEQTRMHVQKHLEMAQEIQAKLEGSSKTDSAQE